MNRQTLNFYDEVVAIKEHIYSVYPVSFENICAFTKEQFDYDVCRTKKAINFLSERLIIKTYEESIDGVIRFCPANF